MKTIQLALQGEPLDWLRMCGGYYECAKDEKGKRIGPLAGYNGRDLKGRQYVGDIYANFAKAERHGPVLKEVAKRLLFDLSTSPARGRGQWSDVTGFCGAPEGGKALGTTLSVLSGKQYIFPDKKTIALATEHSREKSELIFSRHEPGKGEWWWIVEDVCNNFSTAEELIDKIESYGAHVAGIAGFLNRSPFIDQLYLHPRHGLSLPVVALVRKPMPEYEQDDPEVLEDIRAGNVVWKPKNDWDKLPASMR